MVKESVIAVGSRVAGILAGPHARRCAEYSKERAECAGGVGVLHLDYELGADEAIFDVGGYLGNWAGAMAAQYGTNPVHVFEPMWECYQKLLMHFRRNPRIGVHPYGLGAFSRHEQLAVSGSASSTLLDGETKESVRIRAIDEAMTSLGISEIGLMGLNIEGGEYELLSYMLETGLIERVRHLQVQFHEFVHGSHQMRAEITRILSETHRQTYCRDWVWESWSRINP